MDRTELDRLRGRAGGKSTGRHAAGYAACAWRRIQNHCRSFASRTLNAPLASAFGRTRRLYMVRAAAIELTEQ